MSNLAQVKLGKYFTLAEFVVTATGLDNTPTPDAIKRLESLVINCLDPLREKLGKPVHINSGYRSPLVNSNVVGSSTTSQHMVGEAADIHVDGMTNDDLIALIRQMKLPYDQLIDEWRGTSRWVHISHKYSGNQRTQWLTRRDPGPGRPNEYETVKYGYA